MKLWMARDEGGSLHLFKNYKPYCSNGKWFNLKNMGGWYIGEIERNLFSEVTFENSPQEVELKLLG